MLQAEGLAVQRPWGRKSKQGVNSKKANVAGAEGVRARSRGKSHVSRPPPPLNHQPLQGASEGLLQDGAWGRPKEKGRWGYSQKAQARCEPLLTSTSSSSPKPLHQALTQAHLD